MTMGKTFRTHGEKRNAYMIFVGKPEETTRRPRRRWVDNIKMDLKKI
jgi:threonyl-tRNA synthetase